MPPAPRLPRVPALASRNFRLLWIGLLVSHTGTWMATVGIGWTIYDRTGSPLYLGLNSLAFAIPMVVLPVIGGVVADRVDRLALLKAAQLGMLAGALALAVLVHTGTVVVWMIVALSFLEGVLLAFDNPARHALIPDLVDRPVLMSAVSLASATFNSAAFVGPALAGLIVGLVGAERIYLLFYLNALSFAVMLGMLSRLRGVARHTRSESATMLESLLEGLRYVWATPAARTLVGLAIIASVFTRGYTVLMPVFATDVLHVGARGLGFLLSAPGAGTIAGSVLFAALGELRGKGRYYLAANLLFCACLAAFALSRAFPLSLALLFLTGAASVTSGVTLVTMLQLRTPPRLRGRVLSLATLAFIGAPSIGGMILGSAAAGIGTSPAVLAGAAIVAAVMLLGARRLLAEG